MSSRRTTTWRMYLAFLLLLSALGWVMALRCDILGGPSFFQITSIARRFLTCSLNFIVMGLCAFADTIHIDHVVGHSNRGKSSKD
ncbi:hypothetical protein K504DRAFT_114999 [Pleomassaria siparia CBS 279.74]|uniref:Uncharacterized protein n=1 Tax=Pleomassaria siparia CBS 279.74 TaxID=1314801 RepID=A0A6G1JW06_9PLEO|nr:hypothetical protein K504DRAFT_114999 [Pleomassaria siparia CBS 279.74]